ncbi:putative transcriptional regulator flp [Folsomia candida]|uniref:Putative transcriptional regulator flp n=1 Tax=Folsomia candida TaxID=158441 RepID=A0A226EF29_FOLCA|nr:putative transcriptional regulator flp [Folsomia candida]
MPPNWLSSSPCSASATSSKATSAAGEADSESTRGNLCDAVIKGKIFISERDTTIAHSVSKDGETVEEGGAGVKNVGGESLDNVGVGGKDVGNVGEEDLKQSNVDLGVTFEQNLKMKISAKLLLLVTIAAVTMVFVPPADGLKCYFCDTPKSYDGKSGRMGNESLLLKSGRQHKIPEYSDCKDFNEKTKKEEKYQQECSSHYKDPVCMSSIVEPKYSRCWEGTKLPYANLPAKNKCNCAACVCDKDFCNTANNMNDASKRVVVTLLGVGYLVRAYYFGGSAGF